MTRAELLQTIIDRRKAERYLEIGAQKGKTFDRIHCGVKVGVDVTPGAATFVGTSDAYFKQCQDWFDVVFIDGLHHDDQVLVDFTNAKSVLRRGGVIVLHDCNPILERRQVVPSPGSGGWNGNVWRAWLTLRQRHDLDCACGNFDQGCGVVLVRGNTDRLRLDKGVSAMTYTDLDADRKRLLRLMDADELLRWMGD